MSLQLFSAPQVDGPPPAAPSPLEPSDGALAMLVQRGDQDAMGALYVRFYSVVHGVLLAHADRDDVADLAHDVFVQAMSRIDTLRDPAAFGAWIAQIARNAARMRRRHSRRFVPIDDQLIATPTVDPTAADEIMAAVRALPVAYRETLILRLVEGLSGVEIATRLGMTHGSVRVNLSKGMAMLRRALERER